MDAEEHLVDGELRGTVMVLRRGPLTRPLKLTRTPDARVAHNADEERREMAIPEELARFVRESLTRGVPREQITGVLQQAGWRGEQVREALAAYAEVGFPVPVPRPRPYLSAREAFLYLVLFTTLYLSAYHLGSLAFQLIERAFPDPAWGEEAAARGHEVVRWAVANLVVAFPVFLYVSWRLQRQLAADPAQRASRVRRWLTYLTLFVAAGILVGDAVALVHSFLGGELSARFGLKALVVSLIAGGIFGYYLSDLQRDEQEVGA
ncbi:MAG: DUF5671 domain-containing protein [Candidatus Latescibacterota bacterium]